VAAGVPARAPWLLILATPGSRLDHRGRPGAAVPASPRPGRLSVPPAPQPPVLPDLATSGPRRPPHDGPSGRLLPARWSIATARSHRPSTHPHHQPVHRLL